MEGGPTQLAVNRNGSQSSVIFVRFYHVGGGCDEVSGCNLLKLRITVQHVMQKARVVEKKKTHRNC